VPPTSNAARSIDVGRLTAPQGRTVVEPAVAADADHDRRAAQGHRLLGAGDGDDLHGEVGNIGAEHAARALDRGPHPGFRDRSEVDDTEEFVDVDVLAGKSASEDVVARRHHLDAEALEVGVQVAGRR